MPDIRLQIQSTELVTDLNAPIWEWRVRADALFETKSGMRRAMDLNGKLGRYICVLLVRSPGCGVAGCAMSTAN
jgi:hypothetical protein